MFEYHITADELAKLRAKYPPGMKVAFTCATSDSRMFIGTIAWVNDTGTVIVDWDNDDSPQLIVSKKIIKSTQSK